MKQQESIASVNMTAVLDDVKASDETDTTKTGSTPPSSSDTASSSSTLNDEPESPLYDDAILTHLARQLEYYFSIANLEKDTYVETLRQLNDGYVPVTILQRFSKVQAFTPIETVDAIIKAATEFSSLLEVASIDTKTGKRVSEEQAGSSSNTILAVGSTTGKPLDLTGLPGVVPSTPKSPVQNTIIIREVDNHVTEEDVRALFDDEHCPAIQSLYLDVFNCWFVTLDTDSRDDMLYVMMSLRCQYLGDEPVKARLKSLVRQVDPTHAPGLPLLTPTSSYNHLTSLAHQESGGSKTNKRRAKKRNKNNSNNNRGNANNNSNTPQGKKAVQQKGSRDSTGNNKKAEVQQQPKPDLSAASFPALGDATASKVEVVGVDKDNMESAPKVAGSDSASTATTMSSSSSSVAKGKQQLGGYAAALLKSKPHKADKEGSGEAWKESETTAEDAAMTTTTKKETMSAVAAPQTQVVVKPPVWGGGRSFADVLAM
ncbi:La ribonucleoprotein domain family member 4B [Seminavis robusta]|uniref:La ribonucleoprotein domain family member 4B n=1 Tax=Seminavis robusta TaxID=568900 RepID=A0A9N8DCS1_9STRA|nr:La ribonucleoprotein domain family member 4B [Seminavis robusta]|eukprot:Sro63_g036040.1 La ribonucleoprotein domain family member 4B (486) ;mRNA; r:122851-124518